MKITAAASTERLTPAMEKQPTSPPAQPPPVDRVSALDTHRAAAVARGAQANAAQLRLVRLAHIGEAIQAGTYQPSASQVASRILDAAEIDEHLHAILATG